MAAAGTRSVATALPLEGCWLPWPILLEVKGRATAAWEAAPTVVMHVKPAQG